MIKHRMHDPEFTPEPAVIPKPPGWPDKRPARPPSLEYKPSRITDNLVAIAAVVVIIAGMLLIGWLLRESPPPAPARSNDPRREEFGYTGEVSLSADGKTAYLFSDGRLWEVRDRVAREVVIESTSQPAQK